MKLLNLNVLVLSFIALLFASCDKFNSDNPLIPDAEGKISAIEISSPSKSKTKVGFNDLGPGEGNGMELKWEKNDIITIYTKAGYRVSNFICTEVDKRTQNAIFQAQGEKIYTENNYIAVYPASDAATLADRNASIENTLRNQEQSGDGLVHLDDYLFMKSEFEATKDTFIDFTYEVSTFVLTFEWEESTMPTSVMLEDDGKSFKLTKTTGGFSIDNSTKEGKAYFMVLPNNSTSARLMTFKVSNTSSEIVASATVNFAYAAGKTFRVTIDPLGITFYDSVSGPSIIPWE